MSSLELVQKINAMGISILFIEHVMKAVAHICSRVVVLNSGTVLAEGEPGEVMHRDEVIKAYLGEDYHNAIY
jgi:ABC-type branched-chain amino acid transport systems, ATPase component